MTGRKGPGTGRGQPKEAAPDLRRGRLDRCFLGDGCRLGLVWRQTDGEEDARGGEGSVADLEMTGTVRLS